MYTSLLLEMTEEAAPERSILGRSDEAIVFSELAAQARRGAAFLASRNAGTVVFVGLNGNAFPLALFASGFIGKPFAPLNYRLADVDLRQLLARTAPSVAIVDDVMLPRVEGVQDIELIARSKFEAICTDASIDVSGIPQADPDIAVLLFTSGTTGEPKAAVLRHRNLTSYVISTVEFLGSGENEAALVSVPPYHIAGISAVLTGIYGGRRIVYVTEFTPEDWVKIAVSEKISHAMVVPTMLGRILDVLEKQNASLPDLKALSYGGGRMPLAVIERALKILPHVDFVNAYGLTETSSTISVLGPEDHRLALASGDPRMHARLGSVGKPLPSIELQIRDANGNALPAGTSGEIHVRGEQVSGEYLNRKAVASDGWFPTNDGGWLDEEGYLYIEGRLDDVIVRGGENISPGEVEDVLRAHPGVVDVAVVGIPDEEWGERLAAIIVRGSETLSQNELAGWVKSRLRSTKTPEIWVFRDLLPYNDTGKLLRRVLKSELATAVVEPTVRKGI